jgi:hypothetical protein
MDGSLLVGVRIVMVLADLHVVEHGQRIGVSTASEQYSEIR